jgi:hypothetical protein
MKVLNVITIALILLFNYSLSLGLKIKGPQVFGNKGDLQYTEDSKALKRTIVANPQKMFGWAVGASIPFNRKGGACKVPFDCEFVSKGCLKNVCQ